MQLHEVTKSQDMAEHTCNSLRAMCGLQILTGSYTTVQANLILDSQQAYP